MSRTRARKVLIIGIGAQAKYVLETLSYRPELEPAGLVDLQPTASTDSALGLPVLGGLSAIDDLLTSSPDAAIVCCADSEQKQALFERVRAAGVPIVSAIHPRACIARNVEIGEGTIINACAVVQPYARVAEGVMIHASTVVEHDNVIGAFANLAPGVKLAGWVEVGAHVRVLTGASVIPRIRIGTRAVVGAGAAVIRDVPSGATVVGVPARELAANGKGGDVG